MNSFYKACIFIAILISLILNVALIMYDIMNFKRFITINITVFTIAGIAAVLRYLCYVAIRENPE
jgi:HJR/Mrr/RecB family endonuclease